MPRRQISDQLWFKFRAVILNSGIYDKPKLRMTIEGILFKLKTGCPWRDVPDFFGKWIPRSSRGMTKGNKLYENIFCLYYRKWKKWHDLYWCHK